MEICGHTYGQISLCVVCLSDRRLQRQLGATEPMMTDHKAHLWLPRPGAALSAPSCLYCEGQRPSMTSNPPLLQLPIKQPSYPPTLSSAPSL